MNWYYALGTEREGPVTEEEFRRLAQQNVIQPATLVWSEGMAEWKPYSALDDAGAPPLIGGTICAGCGKVFPAGNVITLGGQLYCASCKPAALQRLREGLGVNTEAEATRNKHRKHEASVKSVGWLYLVGGALLMVASVSQIFFAIHFGVAPTIGRSISMFVLGVTQLWVGSGVRRV
jgi:hypothetical protein